jgi:hypothetical protein
MAHRRGGSVAAFLTSLVVLDGCQSVAEAPPDGPPAGALSVTSGHFCGGIAAFACPAGHVCVDDPHDDCDPRNGGADCGGICVVPPPDCGAPGRDYVSRDLDQCARIRYFCDADREAFSDDCGCGCEDPAPPQEPCGNGLCARGETCCNESCGTCAARSDMCIQIACE